MAVSSNIYPCYKEGHSERCITWYCNGPFSLRIRGTHTGKCFVGEVFNRMSCQSIRLLETIFSSSRTMPDPIPAIWQKTVCKPVISALLTGHLDPLIYPQWNTSWIF